MSGSETLLSTKSFSGRTVGAVLVLGVLVAGGRALAQPNGDAGTGSRPAADAGPVVAVMPFVNVSGRPEDDWMGDGIAETLISGVQSSSGLPVVDRSAAGPGGPAAGARGRQAPTRPDAPEPGVSWLVEGGFQRVDERLRIVARVIDVETGAAREIAKIDGRTDELFALQDRIVTEVAEGLVGLVGTGGPAPAPRVDAIPVSAVARPNASGRRTAGRPVSAASVGPVGGRGGGGLEPGPRRAGRAPARPAVGAGAGPAAGSPDSRRLFPPGTPASSPGG